MSKQDDNKTVVGRWFTEFWGKTVNLGVIDEIAAPEMLLKYSLHEPRRGRADIKAFMTDFRVAFPDLNFWGTADLIAEGDYVVGQWEGGGTHTGPAFNDFLIGRLPAANKLECDFAALGVEVVYFPYTRSTSSSALRRTLQNIDVMAGHSSHGAVLERAA
jgi:hypothetical protein